MKSKFFYSQVMISIAVNVANACNIVFMLMALRLPAESFAEITSILAITFLFSVSQSSARNELLLVYKETGSLAPSIARSFKTLFRIALLEGLVVGAGSVAISHFLHFDSPLPFIIAAGCSITYVLNGIMQGIFAAENKIRSHAVALVTDSLMRIPLALVLFGDGYQSEDAAWVMLLASSTSLCINALRLTPKQRKAILQSGKTANHHDGKTATVILASTLLIGMAVKIDVLWAKHILSAEMAGVYGMMSFVASVLFLNSSGVVRSSLSFLKKGNMSRMIRLSYAIIMGICMTCIVGFYVIGQPLLRLLSDDASMIDATSQLMLFAAATAYCIINFNFQILSVLHRNVHLALSALLVALVAISLFSIGYSMQGIALSQILVMMGMLFVYVPTLLYHKKRATSAHIHEHHFA